MRRWYLLLAALLLAWALWAQPASKPFVPSPPPDQPLPFSHKKHAGTLKLPCKGCHSMPDPGDMMTFAGEAKCMSCHSAVKTDSPHIQRLAALALEKKPVPWVRVYQLPSYVNWSHKAHLDAGATCATCHGAVAETEKIAKTVDISMGACMDCHRANKASLDCTFCHQLSE